MVEKDRDQQIYQLANEYLLKLNILGIDQALLEKYQTLPTKIGKPNSLNDIYRDLLIAAQTANMKPAVIGGAIGDFTRLGLVLGDFDPTYVHDQYGADWELLLDTIEQELQPRGQIRRTSRSIWPSFCRTILTGASFMLQFDNADDFYQWADFFDRDDRARPALPMLLQAEIHGLGFPLACDFLKELGYLNFGKPDVHIRDIFTGLQLCPPKPSNYDLFKALIRVAKNVAQTPYAVDKIFWLIGSGFFYMDTHIGNHGRIGRQKQAFITFVQTTM